jgi:hypothetical protein
VYALLSASPPSQAPQLDHLDIRFPKLSQLAWRRQLQQEAAREAVASFIAHARRVKFVKSDCDEIAFSLMHALMAKTGE